MSTENTQDKPATEGCAPATGSQPVTVAKAIAWAMRLCREAAANAEYRYKYHSGSKKQKLAEEAKMQSQNAHVAIAHLERVLAENAEVSDVCPPLTSETEKPRTGTRSLH